jgi:hypothetical protein
MGQLSVEGRIEITRLDFHGDTNAYRNRQRRQLRSVPLLLPPSGHCLKCFVKCNGLMSAKRVDRISSGGACCRERGGKESQQQHGQGCYRVDKRISRAYIKQECIHQP